MLHIVKSIEKLPLVIPLLREEDALLLVEGAIYAAHEKSQAYASIKSCVGVYVLQEDLMARGWEHKVAKTLDIVDMAGFVDLTVTHANSVTW